ncbi:efflux RND transporter periplasmic adaptor subunit [Colwelliaceae bacterium 6441]
MNTEQKIQQLQIDRTEKSTSYKAVLMVSLSLVMISSVLFWLAAPANKLNADQMPIDRVTQPQPAFIQTETINAVGDSVPTKPIEQMNPLSNTVLDASGHIVARRIATVSSRVTGKLEKLTIEEGISVRKSQIIAELDDKQAQISYQLALADLAAQQARYDEMQVMKKYAQQKAQRREQLLKDQLISQEINDDSQLENAQLSAQLKNRYALVELAKQRAELALYQLEQHKIRAPFDGVVISKNAQVGELISAGTSGGGFIRTGVGTIVDMSSLEIEVEVGESYINRVYADQKVIAILDAYPNWKINSEVIAVIPTADRQKASIKVRVKLLEIDSRVLPDMGVKVSFLSPTVIAKR